MDIRNICDDNQLKLFNDLSKDLNRIFSKKTPKAKKVNTIAHISTETLYNGVYFIKISNGLNIISRKVIVNR
jgi:hypothetical protein